MARATISKKKAAPRKAPSRKNPSVKPPAFIDRDAVLRTSRAVLAKKDIPTREYEDLFRIKALGMDWDIGVQVYEPKAKNRIARGADGKRIGCFLLHGGAGDFTHVRQ